MTATMTLSPALSRSLLQRLQRESDDERDAEREAAIAELAEANAKLTACVPALDKRIADADAALAKARVDAASLVGSAESVAQEARRAKRAATWPLERDRDSLAQRLETELRHPAIGAALAEVEQVRENNRTIPGGKTGKDERSAIDIATAIVAWCAKAREQLLALQFTATDAVEMAVDAILEGRPR